MLNQLAQEIYANARAKGFYEEAPSVERRVVLIHAELSEAIEADRVGKYCMAEIRDVDDYLKNEPDHGIKADYERHIKGTVEEEMADVIIRVLDWAAYNDVDIDAHVRLKMKYNTIREYKHGNKKY